MAAFKILSLFFGIVCIGAQAKWAPFTSLSGRRSHSRHARWAPYRPRQRRFRQSFSNNINVNYERVEVKRVWCGFGTAGGERGLCIDVDYEKCTGDIPFKSGECGSPKGNGHCCIGSKFESCPLDNIGCGHPRVKNCWTLECRMRNRGHRRLLLSKVKAHFEKSAQVRRRRRLNSKLLSGNTMKCGDDVIYGDSRRVKLRQGSQFVYKYLNNMVPKLGRVFDVHENGLKSASNGNENLYDLGIRKANGVYVFTCCQDEKSICDVVEDVNDTGNAVTFRHRQKVLKIFKHGGQMKYSVSNSGGRRLLTTRAARTGAC